MKNKKPFLKSLIYQDTEKQHIAVAIIKIDNIEIKMDFLENDEIMDAFNDFAQEILQYVARRWKHKEKKKKD